MPHPHRKCNNQSWASTRPNNVKCEMVGTYCGEGWVGCEHAVHKKDTRQLAETGEGPGRGRDPLEVANIRPRHRGMGQRAAPRQKCLSGGPPRVETLQEHDHHNQAPRGCGGSVFEGHTQDRSEDSILRLARRERVLEVPVCHGPQKGTRGREPRGQPG